MAQLRLAPLLAGSHEVVVLPPRRRPGRPKRVREEGEVVEAAEKRRLGRPKKVPVEDKALQAIIEQPPQPGEQGEVGRRAKRRLECGDAEFGLMCGDASFGLRMRQLAAMRGC